MPRLRFYAGDNARLTQVESSLDGSRGHNVYDIPDESVDEGRAIVFAAANEERIGLSELIGSVELEMLLLRRSIGWTYEDLGRMYEIHRTTAQRRIEKAEADLRSMELKIFGDIQTNGTD